MRAVFKSLNNDRYFLRQEMRYPHGHLVQVIAKMNSNVTSNKNQVVSDTSLTASVDTSELQTHLQMFHPELVCDSLIAS